MDSYKCKIKQILEQNKQDYSAEFSQFLLHEQNLQQLSKLVLELKNIKAVENNLHIQEPQSTIESESVTCDQQNHHDADDTLKQHFAEAESSAVEENIESTEHLNLSENQSIQTSYDIQNIAAIEIPNDFPPEEFVTENQLDDATQHATERLEVEYSTETSELESVMHTDSDHLPLESTTRSEIEKNRQEIESVFRRSKYEDIKFQVENARVGQHYQSKIAVISQHDVNDIRFKADSFKFPDDGFYFDAETQTVLGEPKQAQELEFSFQFYVDQETRSAQCRLNVIADPRSLWKVLEPEAGQHFFKQHSDQALIETENYKIVAASRRGRSHEHAGTFRDDDFSITQIENSPWSVITVADGAGSASYSREGSRIAVEIVQSEFKRYLNPHTSDALIEDLKKWQVGSQDTETSEIAAKLNQQFHLVYYEIYKSIIAQIEHQANELDVNPKLFSTTLLVAVICKLKDKTFMSTFSVGDGAIAVYSENNVRLMNVPDGGEYAGQTKFLDRSIAQEFNTRLKIGCFTDTDAIMLMTDGISDPIFETDSGLANHTKWQKLYTELDPLMQIESADTALLEWMHFFTPGHHDDRTMAVLWNKH
ncbi:PP2C family serine/threonine-protein phosphatase [Acinetobacter piscicola]|uniref:PP2C family serine/threonine-protein phosphatase n=1 Tax=Acinetobacter piscicola TaxID=2006115 RepID=UPI000B7E796E|nr:PP2C family serine/threonine-protein phosphatase [Acinetobacter piscicola]